MALPIKNLKLLHIPVFAALSVFLFFFAPAVFLNRILAAAACAGVLLSLLASKGARDGAVPAETGSAHGLTIRILRVAIFVLAAFYLDFAVFGFDLFFIPNDFQAGPLPRLAYLGLGFVWSCYVLSAALGLFASLGARAPASVFLPAAQPVKGYPVKWLTLFAVLFAALMVWQRAYNPAVLSYDSWEYLAGWRGYLDGWSWAEGSFLKGRSIPYVFLVSWICHLAPSAPEVAWIVVFHDAAFAAMLSTALMYFHQRRIRLKYLLACAILLPLIPSFGLHTVVIWCDLACGLSFLWLAWVLLKITCGPPGYGSAGTALAEGPRAQAAGKPLALSAEKSNAPFAGNLSLCLQLCLSLTLVYFARPNTFLVYLVTAPILAALFLRHKRWPLLGAVVVSVILVLAIRFPGYRALGAADFPHLEEHKYFASMHDMHATYYNGGTFSDKTLAAMKKYIPEIDNPATADRFYPDWVVKDHYLLSGLTTREFIAMYADSFIRNPVKMAKSMLYRNRAYWVIDAKAEVNGVNYTDIYDPASGSYGLQAPDIGVFRQENILTGVMDKYAAMASAPLPSVFFWRFGIWTALIVVTAAALLTRGRYARLLIFLPVFVYLFTLLITSGWTDYRYGLPVFFTGLFLPPALALSETKEDR